MAQYEKTDYHIVLLHIAFRNSEQKQESAAKGREPQRMDKFKLLTTTYRFGKNANDTTLSTIME